MFRWTAADSTLRSMNQKTSKRYLITPVDAGHAKPKRDFVEKTVWRAVADGKSVAVETDE